MPEESKNTPKWLALLEIALKVGPFIGAALIWVFSLYSNQTNMIKHDADVDRRLGELERAQSMQDRAMVERLAKIDAALSELNHDLQFYQQTRGK